MLMMVCEGSTASSCGLAGTVMGLVSPDCSSLRSERERLVGILTLTLAPASPIFCASWNERVLSSRVLPLMACLPIALPTPSRVRSEEHTSELQALMRISYAVFCLQKQNNTYKPLRHGHLSNCAHKLQVHTLYL